jgi:hypothetical protein
MIDFPIAGIETYWWLPVLVAFGISSIASMGGVTGAFLLLPFQMSVLGFTGPAVSSTNLMFNVLAIPSGVYRYSHEKRMVWTLAWTIVIASVPGIFLGVIVRVRWLPNPTTFKLFAAVILMYLAIRLILDIARKRPAAKVDSNASRQFDVVPRPLSLRAVSYNFNGEDYTVATWKVALLSFIVGIVGGAYGVGGGAFIAPFIVVIFRLPVHSIAGATLFSTFVCSIAGVLFYALVGHYFAANHQTVQPDWLLGLLFGIGGAIGVYTGARLQKRVPEKPIKTILAAAALFASLKYAFDFFF